jgi:uncharacterized protein
MEMLNAVEVRVLGSLIEKEATTPEYYPLSLNALVNACNQKSNREPVVDFDEETVLAALEGLREKHLAFVITGSRVTKYSQRISETLNLGRRELAVLCVLLLRGPQTVAEIKDRSERLFSFTDSSEVERILEKLGDWPNVGALVTKLARQPGQKEARYAHLLAGEPAIDALREPKLEVQQSQQTSRVAQLEGEVQQLRAELYDLKRRFDELESQLR